MTGGSDEAILAKGPTWTKSPERLAILVVYFFGDDLHGLISQHLEQIRHNTAMPYRVYACALRLGSRQLDYLRSFPEVEVFEDLELAKWREGQAQSAVHHEHNGLLELLRGKAEMDGASHFLALHQDSFPVTRGWDQRFRMSLAEGADFVTVVPYSYNACLFWDAAWQARKVPLSVAEPERELPEFRNFKAMHPSLDMADGGLGFIYQAWLEDRTWRALEPSGPNLWGGEFLHMVGATRMMLGSAAPTRIPAWAGKLLRVAARLAEQLLPPKMVEALRGNLRGAVVNSRANTGRSGSLHDKRSQIDMLVRDPNGFIASCIDGSLAPELTAGRVAAMDMDTPDTLAVSR